MKDFNKAEVNTKDIDSVLFKENKSRFGICSVNGHNKLTEQKIGSVSVSLEAAEILR